MATKSGGGKQDTTGDARRGGQKAVTGSAVSPEVAEEQRKAVRSDEPDNEADADLEES